MRKRAIGLVLSLLALGVAVMASLAVGAQSIPFDDQLSAEWMQQVLWGVSYTAFEQVEQGALAKFDVAATVTRRGLHRPGPPGAEAEGRHGVARQG